MSTETGFVVPRPQAPLYNRFMAYLAVKLYNWSRACEGESLRCMFFSAKRRKIFERTDSVLFKEMTESELEARLRQGVTRFAELEPAALRLGIARGKAAGAAVLDEQTRAKAQRDIEQVIAKEPDRFIVKHDEDEPF